MRISSTTNKLNIFFLSNKRSKVLDWSFVVVIVSVFFPLFHWLSCFESKCNCVKCRRCHQMLVFRTYGSAKWLDITHSHQELKSIIFRYWMEAKKEWKKTLQNVRDYCACKLKSTSITNWLELPSLYRHIHILT